MRRYFYVVVLVAIAAIAIGCAKKPAAVVNGSEISESVLKWNLNQRMSQHKASGAVVGESLLRGMVLDQLITEKLLAQGAKEKGLLVGDAELQSELQAITKSIGKDAFDRTLREASLSKEDFTEMLREKLMGIKFSDSLVKEGDITDEDLKSYFKESPTPFLMPEQVNVRFIQTGTKEQADGIMNEIKKGKSFDKLADELKEKKAATVSQYSWISPSFFSPAISDALKNIGLGKYDGPFQSGDSYFIFRVKERKHERAKTFEEAKPEIKNILFSQRRDDLVMHWIAERKSKADITVN